jgi:hypothetical protein
MCCQACGANAPTRYVEFYSNIGMILFRFEKSIKGYLCKSCVSGYFWEYTLASLALGWWGFISLMANPLIILNNVFRYIPCLFMPRAPRAETIPAGDFAGLLRPHVQAIRTRLDAGVGLLQVAQETADAAGLAVEDVLPYVLAVSRDNVRRHSPAC